MHKLWIDLRSSLWFVPALIVLIAIVGGIGFVELDVVFADQLKPWGWMPFLNAGAAGARGMLTAIASSMITVAGVAFSITIVTLSLASTQYTPRILRNFMRDRMNQSVLGVFVGIYAYCLIVLRTIRDGDEGGGFVPLLAVFVGVLLALIGIGSLIFFIHHVAASIQASSILDAISRETFESIETLFPQKIGEPAESAAQAEEKAGEIEWHSLPALGTGYVQSVDGEALWKLADDEDVVLRIEREIGDFVIEGAPIISSSRPLDDAVSASCSKLFAIGNFRTVGQDVWFGIRQIVDIALKALSPGVNDTTTAVSCLDYLSAILYRLASREMASPYRKDGNRLRVIARAPSFPDFVARSLDEIRLCASGNVTILLCLLGLLRRVAAVAEIADRKAVLRDYAELVIRMAEKSVDDRYDRARVNVAIRELEQAVGGNLARLAQS